MDKTLPDNITISELRRLRESYKNFLGKGAVVSVELDLWNHSQGRITEKITVWDGIKHTDFQSLTEAREHLNKLKKEKSDGKDTTT